jgi:hypothetical protein
LSELSGYRSLGGRKSINPDLVNEVEAIRATNDARGRSYE